MDPAAKVCIDLDPRSSGGIGPFHSQDLVQLRDRVLQHILGWNGPSLLIPLEPRNHLIGPTVQAREASHIALNVLPALQRVFGQNIYGPTLQSPNGIDQELVVGIRLSTHLRGQIPLQGIVGDLVFSGERTAVI